MVARISVKDDIAKVLGTLAKQFPQAAEHAAQRAVIKVAWKVKEAEEREIARVFDRPTPYALKSVKIRYRRREIEATVWLKDEGDAGKGTPATKFLAPQIGGGAGDGYRRRCGCGADGTGGGMSKIDDGGHAFPHSRLGSDCDGMTLRDYVAINLDLGEVEINDIALSTAIAGRPAPDDEIEIIKWKFEILMRVRLMAADAFLKVREVKP